MINFRFPISDLRFCMRNHVSARTSHYWFPLELHSLLVPLLRLLSDAALTPYGGQVRGGRDAAFDGAAVAASVVKLRRQIRRDGFDALHCLFGLDRFFDVFDHPNALP